MTSMDALRYREKMDRESKAVTRWHKRYGAENGLAEDGQKMSVKNFVPSLKDASVAIVIMGGALAEGAEPTEMLIIRLERGIAEWWNGQSNNVIVSAAPSHSPQQSQRPYDLLL